MVVTLAQWWAARMAELIPQRFRSADRDSADALLAVPLGQDAAQLILRERGQERPLGSIVLDDGAAAALAGLLAGRKPGMTLLRLPADMMLERDVAFPVAALGELDTVLAYEMNRFTPFDAADLYWGQTLLRQDHSQGRIWVRLSFVRKVEIAALVQLLRAAGHAPSGLRVPGPDGLIRRIGLVAHDPARTRHTRRLAMAAAACAVLGVVAVGLPILRQMRALGRIEAEIARLRPAIAEADQLRRQVAARTGGADVLAAEAARLGSALRAIATLTAVLPDDTFLTALTLRQRQVTLNGQSADSARLIPRLSADPALREVSFQAPVTRAEPSRAELFSIRLVLGS